MDDDKLVPLCDGSIVKSRTGQAEKVLLIQISSSRDGSAFSGLLLLNGLSEAGLETHVAFGHSGPMEAVYRRRGHQVHVVEHKSWLRREALHRFGKDVLAEIRRVREYERLYQAVLPAIVYVNTSVSLAAVIAARWRRVPCVWHMRELFSDIGGELMAPSLIRRVLPVVFKMMADRLVAPSRAIAENLLKESSDRVEIIPNAVGTHYFGFVTTMADARREFGLPDDDFIIGVPGTLRPVKGHAFFFRAVAPTLRERSDMKIVVSGSVESGFAATLTRMVEELGISSRVTFLGAVSDMRYFYRSCDLVCIPSRAESFGRTVIEAMAIGTPLVATSVGGIMEIVDDGQTGLLVDYDDDEALRAAVRDLMDDEALRRELAERAKSVAKQKYHESSYQKQILDVVTGVLQQSPGPAS